jgi:hypothetical protein
MLPSARHSTHGRDDRATTSSGQDHEGTRTVSVFWWV